MMMVCKQKCIICIFGPIIATANDGSGFEDYLNDRWRDECPVYVSEEMQCLIKNNPEFSVSPIGPIADHINSQCFHRLIPPSFANSYVVYSNQDVLTLRKLFNANDEAQPCIIVYPLQTEMYKDVDEDTKANAEAVAALKSENPTIANLLIDHFAAHTECKLYKCII